MFFAASRAPLSKHHLANSKPAYRLIKRDSRLDWINALKWQFLHLSFRYFERCLEWWKIIIKLNLSYHQKLCKSCGRTSGELSVNCNEISWFLFSNLSKHFLTFLNFKAVTNKQIQSHSEVTNARRKRQCVVRNVFFYTQLQTQEQCQNSLAFVSFCLLFCR